jgi:hypothetical protein
MNSQLLDFNRLLLVFFAALLLKVGWQLYVPRLRRRWKRVKARLPRRWKPRSPKDCPHCCQGLSLESRPVEREVEPYAKRKSTRGRKKEICTAGFACLNPRCETFGITDDQVHALVGNGKRGIKNDIQHFRCQWCRADFSCRRNTPLYYLKTASDRIEMVLWLMAEGVDISVVVCAHPIIDENGAIFRTVSQRFWDSPTPTRFTGQNLRFDVPNRIPKSKSRNLRGISSFGTASDSTVMRYLSFLIDSHCPVAVDSTSDVNRK